jgi:hypothetical protein
MFDRHYHIHDEHSRVEAARINAMSQGKFANTLKDIYEAEIKSKDRVDITLEEYERLKSDLSRYQERCRKMSAEIMQLGIPYEIVDKLDTDSIDVTTCQDPVSFKTMFRIMFTVDDYVTKGLGYK